ncbi:uncharacterized protein LOC119093113 [Pollicipes pollicipes]|nr:uncharacterized protein LOC119093113 [Pollicipes pollicipes]
MGFVNKIISRLDSEEQCSALTHDLCTRHIAYGAFPHQMLLLGEQFIAVVRATQERSGHWDRHTQASWEKLFQWITWTYEQAIHTAQRDREELNSRSHSAVTSGCLAGKCRRRNTDPNCQVERS